MYLLSSESYYEPEIDLSPAPPPRPPRTPMPAGLHLGGRTDLINKARELTIFDVSMPLQFGNWVERKNAPVLLSTPSDILCNQKSVTLILQIELSSSQPHHPRASYWGH